MSVFWFMGGVAGGQAADMLQPVNGELGVPQPERITKIYKRGPVFQPRDVFEWQGFYSGLLGSAGLLTPSGVALLDATGGYSTPPIAAPLGGGKIGEAAGVFSGYSVFVREGLYVGGEIQGEWANARASFGRLIAPADLDAGSVRKEWDGAVMGRMGWAPGDGRALMFGEFGGALAGFAGNAHAATPVGYFTASRQTARFGWTAGLGADVGLTQRVFLHGEFRFSEYFYGGGIAPSPVGLSSGRLLEERLALGAGYRF